MLKIVNETGLVHDTKVFLPDGTDITDAAEIQSIVLIADASGHKPVKARMELLVTCNVVAGNVEVLDTARVGGAGYDGG